MFTTKRAATSVFILPEAMLAGFALATLLLDFFLTKKEKSWNSLTAMLGVAFSGGALLVMYKGMQGGQAYAFGNSIIIDPFFIFFGFIFLASTALTILISVKYMEIEKEQHGEYYALMLFATVGMMFLACGNDLIVLFVALETMALSFYVLTGFLRRDRKSNEAAMKYVLMGAFSSGILAYGFSILYGISGSTNLITIGNAVTERSTRYGHGDVLTILALGTVAAGVFFKIAAVPFHQWAPDVYEGAPTPISAYVSVASKAASFALLLAPVPHRFLAGQSGLGRRNGSGRSSFAHRRHSGRDHAIKHKTPARVLIHHASRLHSARPGRRRKSGRHA